MAAYKREFREHLNMPLNGPDHMKGTAFYWTHKNVLFISVDVFEKGRSNQGGIRTGVTGEQLAWMERVITEHGDVDHIIVMGHTPCLGPVRMWSSSGRMYSRGGIVPPENPPISDSMMLYPSFAFLSTLWMADSNP